MLSSLPRSNNSPLAKCGCKKHGFHGDHTATCTAHSGATKAHGGMVSFLGPMFRTDGHTVRMQQANGRGDVEIRNYMRDQAGSRTWSSTCPSHTTVAAERFAIAAPGP